MGKRIVLFNDLPGYGKVALAAMVPLFLLYPFFNLRWFYLFSFFFVSLLHTANDPFVHVIAI